MIHDLLRMLGERNELKPLIDRAKEKATERAAQRSQKAQQQQ